MVTHHDHDTGTRDSSRFHGARRNVRWKRNYTVHTFGRGLGRTCHPVVLPIRLQPRLCRPALYLPRYGVARLHRRGRCGGISADSAHCHKEFISEYDLGFPLLTDRLGEVANKYGILLEEFEHHKNIPKRSIVAIDSSRTIQFTWAPDTQYTPSDISEIEDILSWYREGGSTV
jgi:hypothetical protein